MTADDICLQINLCPGDVAYAEHTVPHLINAHRTTVGHRLAIVDVNKPDNTHANRRDYPEPEFTENVKRISALARKFQTEGLFDEILVLDGNQHSLCSELSKKFTGNLIPPHVSHDYHGAAYAAYLAAIDYPQQRFVLHYDADILLHQHAGYDWAQDALAHWETIPEVIAASPRISPPGFTPDAPSQHEGRPFTACPCGWLNDWFSTRCFLMDQQRLNQYLPLTHGRYFWELLFYRIIKRRYPPGPELMLFKSAGVEGARKLTLSSTQAWLLHPASKPPEFLKLLPHILSKVQQGLCPQEQIGHADIIHSVWPDFLYSKPLP